MRNLFYVLDIIAVAGIVLFWIPFRRGRRPLALYDLLAAVLIGGISSGFVGPRSGLSVWLIGLPALMFGISAYVASDQATMGIAKAKGKSVLGYCYTGSYTAVIVAAVAGGLFGRWCTTL